MSPYRRLRNWKVFAVAAVIAASFVVSAVALRERSIELDDVLYQQCVANEQQDAVIVAQLRAAKERAVASLPEGSPVLRHQLEVLDDGIAALEPPDEPDCNPPEGTEP